ncbi:MAG: hypothetical protein LC708_01330, partial [Actinobacteria bacterium]|nr:hypothetical protein [Actinomycetota bacterium]
YNYDAKRTTPGLMGEYFKDPDGTHVFSDTNKVMVRRDTNVNHWWWDQKPGPLVPATGFMVRWTGWITVPATGAYTFGASSNDGARIYIDQDSNPATGTNGDEKTALDVWHDQSSWPTPNYGSPTATLAANTRYHVRVEYYQGTAPSFAALMAKGPFGAGGAQAETVVPASWLSTFAPAYSGAVPGTWLGASASLPPGWTLSAREGYVSARVGETEVTFTDGAGHGHVYSWTGTGYTPTPGEDGVVSLDPSGTLTLHDNGKTSAIPLNRAWSPAPRRPPASTLHRRACCARSPTGTAPPPGSTTRAASWCASTTPEIRSASSRSFRPSPSSPTGRATPGW